MSGFQLAEAFVEFGTRGVGSVNRTIDQTKDRVMGLRSAFSGLGSALAAGVGAAGVVTVLKGIADATLESEAVSARLEAALRANGGAAGWTASQLDELAGSLANFTRFDDEAAKSAQSFLLTLRNVSGEQFGRALEAAADMAAFFKTDLQQAAQTVGRALDNPIRGMMMLRRAGVNLTATQQEQVKSFMKLGEIAQAQDILLEALSSRMGGQAASDAQTLTGQVVQLKNALGDLGEEIGGIVSEGGGSGIMGWLKDAAKGWTDELQGVRGAKAAASAQKTGEVFDELEKIVEEVESRRIESAQKRLAKIKEMDFENVGTHLNVQDAVSGIEKRIASILLKNGGGTIRDGGAMADFWKGTGEKRLTDKERKDQRDKNRGVRRQLRDMGASDDDMGRLFGAALGGGAGGIVAQMERIKKAKDASKGGKSSGWDREIREGFHLGVGADRSRGISDLSPEARDSLKQAVLGNLGGMMGGAMTGNPLAVAESAAKPASMLASTAPPKARSETFDISSLHNRIQTGILNTPDKQLKTKQIAMSDKLIKWAQDGFPVKNKGGSGGTFQ